MNTKFNKQQLPRLYITKILQKANKKITDYLSNINNDYTKEDYEIIKEDLFYMYQEISKLQVIKKNKEEFFELTFEDKFHHNSHFSSIDDEINYWTCLLKSKKGGAEIYNKALGTEDRIKELSEIKKKYNL